MSDKIAFRERPIIITDFETTGLDPQRHEIIDIGAIKVTHSLDVLDTLSLRVIPLHIENAEPRALEINGYNPEDWMYAALPPDAAAAFNGFSKDGILCAWNITFEYDFLSALLSRLNVPTTMDYHRIDIPSLAWALLPDLQEIGMDKMAKYFGLPAEETPHTGIRGARRELELLRKLLSITTPGIASFLGVTR